MHGGGGPEPREYRVEESSNPPGATGPSGGPPSRENVILCVDCFPLSVTFLPLAVNR